VPGGDRVLVGAEGTYEARCRACFDPNLATATEPRITESRIPLDSARGKPNPQSPKR
jgi:hypothetical protein